MRILIAYLLLVCLGLAKTLFADDELPFPLLRSANLRPTPFEVQFLNNHPGPGQYTLYIEGWQDENHVFGLPKLPNVTSAYFISPPQQERLRWSFAQDGQQWNLLLPEKKPVGEKVSVVVLETAEASEQFADGRIVLSALDAQVQTTKDQPAKAKLESQPGNHRIGFWTDPSEIVAWKYTATRPGNYEVELAYSLDGGDATEIECRIGGPIFPLGGKLLPAKLAETKSWYRYTTLRLGEVRIPAAGEMSISVACLKQTGPAVMNLKAITLRPISEGKLTEQTEQGEIVCHARDVTIHGVKVQYEPKPEKNTVGYWVNEKDWVSWDLLVKQPGEYRIEILQGCGKGQGGSEATLRLADQDFPFTVEDTGHFQNFVPREIGTVKITEPGQLQMNVKPVRKAGVAIMDLRQVRLIPVKD